MDKEKVILLLAIMALGCSSTKNVDLTDRSQMMKNFNEVTWSSEVYLDTAQIQTPYDTKIGGFSIGQRDYYAVGRCYLSGIFAPTIYVYSHEDVGWRIICESSSVLMKPCKQLDVRVNYSDREVHFLRDAEIVAKLPFSYLLMGKE